MILIDTSIWVDYFIGGDEKLDELLNRESVLIHPFVVGEIAMGNLRNRQKTLASFQDLPTAVLASHDEVLALISNDQLGSTGLSYIDAHLLASTRLTIDALLWTRDKRLRAVAGRLLISATMPG